jgi:aryl-alcohol dehydrogenase-like predicted oxidoreductase
MRIGLGAGPLGAIDKNEAIRLVHHAYERGVRFFDTAPSYGHSESVLAEALSGRDVEIVTKGGYGVPGIAEWTSAVITQGIEQALRVLRTDCLGGFLLHSCGSETIPAMVEPLVRARAAGKVRAIGYSGDADGLAAAARVAEFDLLEHSYSILDREALGVAWPKRRIAKRILANAPWYPRPERPDIAEYMRRYAALRPSRSDIRDEDLFLRFAVHEPAITVALVGTTRATHLDEMLAAADAGPLPPHVLAELDAKWTTHGTTWRGVI